MEWESRGIDCKFQPKNWEEGLLRLENGIMQFNQAEGHLKSTVFKTGENQSPKVFYLDKVKYPEWKRINGKVLHKKCNSEDYYRKGYLSVKYYLDYELQDYLQQWPNRNRI